MVTIPQSKSQSLFDLSGKIACVTGASAGIGRHIANFLVAQGVKVVGVARREEALAKWSKEHNGLADFVVADLAEQNTIADVAKKVSQKFGDPDILINTAGINTREAAGNVTQEGWQVTLNLNLSAPFFLAQAFTPAMINKKWGRIVNFASLQSYRAFPAGIAYGASKGGVTQMTRAMAEEWSIFGVNTNAIGPGFFPTELTQVVFNDEKRSAKNAAQTCIGRNGNLNDLDGPVQFLCSDASAYVTGQILMVDGGFTVK